MYKEYINDKLLLEKLEKLNEKKYNLKKLIDSNKVEKQPYVVELAGMPRTGKTVSIEKIFEFFLHANYRVMKTKEPAQIVKETYDISILSNLEFNDKTLEISKIELSQCKDNKPDIILQDRGIIDNYIWYQMMYERNEISLETYNEKLSSINIDLKEIDQLYLMIADPKVIIMRDYINQIYLENRKKTTIEGVTKLKNGMENLSKKINSSNFYQIDTTSLTEIDTSILISNSIIDGMTKKLTLKK